MPNERDLGPKWTLEKMDRSGVWKRVQAGRGGYMLGYLDGLSSAGLMRTHVRLRVDPHGDYPAGCVDYAPSMNVSRRAREICEA